MVEVADWMLQCLLMLLTWMRDNPFGGILTFVLLYPVIILLGKFLRSVIHR